MSKNLINDLDELVAAKVITSETAEGITKYYKERPSKSGNRLVIVFGILGSLMVGLGIILIIAHNWDDFGKGIKLILAFLPLLIGQAIAGYLVWKKSDNTAWLEGASTFLIFSIAASISIVGQIYNIQGNLARFLLAWMVLCVPIVYVMRSSAASLLVIAGITWYACEASYFQMHTTLTAGYWLVLLALAPHYLTQLKKYPGSNFTHLHHWLIASSLVITLGTFADGTEQLIVLAYATLFGVLVLVGQLNPMAKERILANGYLVVGSLGTVIIMLVLTFDWFWEGFSDDASWAWISSQESILIIVLLAISGFIVSRLLRTRKWSEINFKSFASIILLLIMFVGMALPAIAQLLANLLVLGLGIFTLRDGANSNRLELMNYGLLIITALILCRFFDIDLSFVIRGILFIMVGLGFFIMNYKMLKKRKEQL